MRNIWYFSHIYKVFSTFKFIFMDLEASHSLIP